MLSIRKVVLEIPLKFRVSYLVSILELAVVVAFLLDGVVGEMDEEVI
jgi:hypothetical protein